MNLENYKDLLRTNVGDSSGIYGFYCKNTKKIYIGRASFLQKRKAAHLNQLNQYIHPNSYLQRAWNKYGEMNFSYHIFLYCEKEELNYYEAAVANLWSSEERFNLGQIGRVIPRTEELNARQSKTMKAKILTPEHIQKLRQNAAKRRGIPRGPIHNEEARRKIGLNNNCKGEKVWKAQFSNEEVFKIRELYMEGKRTSELVKLYKVSLRTISGIVSGKTWKSVAFPVGFKLRDKKKLTENDIPIIRELYSTGNSIKSITKRFGLRDTRTIKRIIEGKAWTKV